MTPRALRHTLRHLVSAAAILSLPALPALAVAQQPATPAPVAVTPALDFSGVIFGSYGYRTDSAAKAATGGQNPNQFGLDRAYLNFRMPAGENGAIRITTDIFQNTNNATNGYYAGWTVRIKYGYAQYTGLKSQFRTGSSLTGRIGVLHTVLIDHQEGFWPRYLGQVAVERNGFFSSADAGVAGLMTLGNKWGEVYGTITNGPGYTSFDRDRFKDIALRASLTPFGNSADMSPILKSFTVTPWFYKGWTASNFAAGGAGQVGAGANGAITDGLKRDRYGLFVGVKERRITAGAEFAQRSDEGSESGANTSTSPRLVRDSTGRVLDAFIVARPLEWLDATKKSNLSIIARIDRFTPATSPIGTNYAGATPKYTYYVLGASYDLTNRLTLALDWQAQSPTDFPPATGTNVRATPRNSTLFAHWQATF
jgi:hypothetical protein